MKKKYKILFGILLFIFVFLVIGVKIGILQEIDNGIYNQIKNWQSNGLTESFKVITNLGGTVALFYMALIMVIILLLCHRKKDGIVVALNLMMSSFICMILKNIMQRPRPPVEERLIEEIGYSFPSGHSTNSMAFYLLTICLIYQNVKNKKLRHILCLILGIFPVLIGFSRVYLRVHYASDMIAGFCLGIMCVILFMSFAYQKIK